MSRRLPWALQRAALLVALWAAIPAVRAAEAAETPWVLDRNSNSALVASAATQGAVDRFAEAYAKANRPRIAIFWNRELSDRLGSAGREVLRMQGQAARDGSHFSLSASRGNETEREASRRTTLSERDTWLVETEFVQRLLDAGAVVLDRAAILRLTGANATGAENLQAVETAALVGKADLLLEILLTPDPNAPLGWGFRSNCKEVKTGRILGTQYLTAMPTLPPQAEAGYQVRNGRYERVAPEPVKVSLRSVGETLAVQAMTELSRRLPSLR